MKKLFFTLCALLVSVAAIAADELEQTATPVIIFDEDNLMVFAHGDGEISLYVDDMLVSNPYYFEQCYEDYSATVTACAQEPGKTVSEFARLIVNIPSMPIPMTPTPEIVIEEFEEYVTVIAVGEGELYMFINGNEVLIPTTIPRTDEEQVIVVTAFARMDGWIESEHVEFTYVISPLTASPMPEIQTEMTENEVIITAVGEGVVKLFLDDEEVPNPYYAGREDEDYALFFYATAHVPGCVTTTTSIQRIVVPAYEPPVPPERTSSPILTVEMISEDPPLALVSVEPSEAGCTLFYRYSYGYEGPDWENMTEWNVYTDPMMFTEPGGYVFETYAASPGKEDSYPVVVTFMLTEPTPMPTYDFEVDGIYYIITEDDQVSVTECPHMYAGDIVIPNTVTYEGVTYMVTAINTSAFAYCNSVSSVSIGNYVTEIGGQAFIGCTGLTEVTLGDYVTDVDDEAFKNCTSLTKLTIGHGLRNLGRQAFAGCTALETVICKPAVPPVMANQNCFDCYQTATLKVYPPVLCRYQTTNYWNQFVNIVGEDTVSPEPNDVDGDGNFGINDITTLIDRLLGN